MGISAPRPGADVAGAPRISVVIPTRNRPDTLAACLQRLAPDRQTLEGSQYEVVVTDDGDADETRALLRRHYAWVRHTVGPQRGPAANRNAGVRATRGEWIAFTDDDTLPDPEWLEQLLRVSVGVDAVEGCTLCRRGLRSPREDAPQNDRGGRWWTCNLAVRRTAFDALGGFDERFSAPHMEDADFRDRAFAAGLAWHFTPLAVIDHPPRRERWGTAWAPIHFAEVLFHRIHSQPFSLSRSLRSVARVRLRAVARAPLSRDGLSALLSLPVELLQMLWSWSSWQQRALELSCRES